MLVRLSRAPVLSGDLRRKTQLFSGTFYMAVSSKGPQKFKTPLQVPVFPGSSLLCHHTKSEKTSDTTSLHSVLICHRTSWQKNKDNKLNTKINVRGCIVDVSPGGVVLLSVPLEQESLHQVHLTFPHNSVTHQVLLFIQLSQGNVPAVEQEKQGQIKTLPPAQKSYYARGASW
ncbi:hypothetical protein TNCV_3356781 [Trichonephila clavipes]|nr:hypothetical protein TNCV_3356781 [Trichonephila clavipes]